VSDLPDAPGAASAELVQVHDRVVRAALARETPLPARFGQSFASEAALYRALRARAEVLERSLERVRGKVEMTVRILLPDPGDAGPAGTAGSGQGSAPREREPLLPRPDTGPGLGGDDPRAGRGIRRSAFTGSGEESAPDIGAGQAYMARLRERQMASAALQRQAEFLQARVSRAVDGFTREEICSPVMLGAHSFSISHLVAREAIEQYRLAIDSLSKGDPTLRLLISGPWAPYSFAHVADE
jgi:hypothetical protein